jgi:glycine reductase complex component B subunit gamma
MIKIAHFINQFFAGIGGEDQADLAVSTSDGSIGASRALAQKLGDQARIVRTVYVGDNYFHEHKDEALKEIIDPIRAAEPDVLVAGPAFNSGRYGFACVEICNAVRH